MGRMRRHGAVELLVVLPDGSKTLIPADFTDAVAAVVEPGTATVGSVEDLVGLAVVVGSLSAPARGASAAGPVVDGAGIPVTEDSGASGGSRLASDLDDAAAGAAGDRSISGRSARSGPGDGEAEVGVPGRRGARRGRAAR